jgi:class 3 adenylate cyclase
LSFPFSQCALSIQAALHAAKLEEDVSLSVKLGIGVGRVSVLHLGGSLRRMEYVAVGEPLVQAFAAEHCAEHGGEIIVSPQAWTLIKEFFEARDVLHDGFIRLGVRVASLS